MMLPTMVCTLLTFLGAQVVPFHEMMIHAHASHCPVFCPCFWLCTRLRVGALLHALHLLRAPIPTPPPLRTTSVCDHVTARVQGSCATCTAAVWVCLRRRVHRHRDPDRVYVGR
jgi:hypothetical protein